MKNLLLLGLMVSVVGFSSCEDDEAPEAENEEEVIDLVSLTFTPQGGGAAITAKATDPDGEGVADFEFEDITLKVDETYTLSITLENTEEGEDITEEVEEEGAEHMFFFGFTNDLFADPTGNGNIDNRQDPVNYNDTDEGGLPVGLSTSWTTGSTASANGSFRVILKHQPDIKTASSGSGDGESDIDLTWNISIEE